VSRAYWFKFVDRNGDFFASKIFDSQRETLETFVPGRAFLHRPAQSNFDAASAPQAVAIVAVGPTSDRPALIVSTSVAPTPAVVEQHPEAIDLVDPIRSLDDLPETEGDQRAAGTPGPQHSPDGDDTRMFGVQVEWPWTLAFGLVPISADSAVEGKMEPEGWLETYLDLQAKNSPLTVPFSAGSYGDAAADPHWEAWAGQALGTIGLSGDFSGGFELTALSFEVDRATLAAGSDYNLAANDNFVAAGASLVVDANALGADDSLIFDGSEETDGRFLFVGGDSDDIFFGGAGDDRIEGLGGADLLSGGAGSDVFVYRTPSDSTGADYDTIADFDPAADRIDLAGAVAGFGNPILGGSLSHASFNDDLAAATGTLGAAQAVWFAPDSGDLAGQIFLIVDGNGTAGYQEGEDYVFAISGAPLEDLTSHTDIFI
jgi:peptidase M10/serralysin-like protein